MTKHITNTTVQNGFHIQYSAITDPGCKRSHNEDDFLVDMEGRFFGVADGVGGLGGGEIASKMALDQIEVYLKNKGDNIDPVRILKMLNGAIEAANTAVYHYGAERHKRIATTVSLIAFYGQKACIANVGDSRVYLWRGNQLRQLTTDHTIKQEMLANGIVSNDKQFAAGIDHVITRAIGAETQVKVDFKTHTINTNDVFLICTDGITSMMPDKEIQASLNGMVSTELAGNDLLKKAKSAGGNDNITLIILAFR